MKNLENTPEMTQTRLTPSNWNHCHYEQDGNWAIISLGSNPDKIETDPENPFSYFVTLIDQDQKELFQEEFDFLEDACNQINDKYSDYWKFVDKSAAAPSSGGCSTCVAH